MNIVIQHSLEGDPTVQVYIDEDKGSYYINITEDVNDEDNEAWFAFYSANAVVKFLRDAADEVEKHEMKRLLKGE